MQKVEPKNDPTCAGVANSAEQILPQSLWPWTNVFREISIFM